MIWSTIVTAVGTAFKSWWDGRQKIKKAKIESKTAKWQAEAKYQMRLAEIEATWDLVALRQAQYSFKDELITLIVFFPLVLWWVPALRSEVEGWIDFVGGVPLWYQILIFGIVAASFGLRWFFRDQGFKLSKGKK